MISVTVQEHLTRSLRSESMLTYLFAHLDLLEQHKYGFAGLNEQVSVDSESKALLNSY